MAQYVSSEVRPYAADSTTQQTLTFLKVSKSAIRYDLSCHAEVAAIAKLPEGTNMSKVKLLVVKEGMKMSRPCPLCERVIQAVGIRRVYYSRDGAIEKMDTRIIG